MADFERIGPVTAPTPTFERIGPVSVGSRPPEAETTSSGLAASFARGAAPYAAGAAIGAAAGAPIAGVGAIPGAMAGMGAVGLTELGSWLYDVAAPHLGMPHIITPKEASDKALDTLGIKRPSTTSERLAEEAGGLVSLGFGSVKGTEDLGKMVLEDRADAAERFIENAYKKAIRPTVAGKGAARKIEQAEQGVLEGIASITRNKGNLRLADKYGREVVGRSPETLDEFVQAIEQTKRPVFEKYNVMAQQAEKAGAKIEVSPIVGELRKFAADPSFNLPKYDGMRAYATATADILEQTGQLPPTVAQNMVKNLNEGLSAFYRASSPEAASRAAVDDLIANQLRGGLDRTLEAMGMPGYQEIRNEYRALKSIEGEVAHRAGVYGRRDPGGGLFGRLGTIASYEELARFATNFEPTSLATAAAIRGGRWWTERLHSPNRAVRRMFDKMEMLQSQGTP